MCSPQVMTGIGRVFSQYGGFGGGSPYGGFGGGSPYGGFGGGSPYGGFGGGSPYGGFSNNMQLGRSNMRSYQPYPTPSETLMGGLPSGPTNAQSLQLSAHTAKETSMAPRANPYQDYGQGLTREQFKQEYLSRGNLIFGAPSFAEQQVDNAFSQYQQGNVQQGGMQVGPTPNQPPNPYAGMSTGQLQQMNAQRQLGFGTPQPSAVNQANLAAANNAATPVQGAQPKISIGSPNGLFGAPSGLFGG